MSATRRKPPASSPRRGPATTAPHGAQFIDPHALMRIKDLQLRAKVVVEGFYAGLHRSPFHGFSVEFTEYRQYSPGDDPRFLDWRLYARTDRYYVKRFEDETTLRCHILLDVSKSMEFTSLPYSKGEYAKTVAATLAYFLSMQRDAVGLVTFDDGIVEYVPARYRHGHLHRLMCGLERMPSGTATDLAAPLERVAATVARRGLVVLVSDLLAPRGPVERGLGYVRARGHDVIVLRTLDPAERSFSFSDPSTFHDMESGRRLYVDPAAARDRYLARFRDHESALGRYCGAHGIDLYTMSTERPLEQALFDLLHARLHRWRRARRHARGGAGGRA